MADGRSPASGRRGEQVAAISNFVGRQVRIPIFVIVIATLVTLVDMSLNVWLHDHYKVLGLFIALFGELCAPRPRRVVRFQVARAGGGSRRPGHGLRLQPPLRRLAQPGRSNHH
jgi:hypothetical protein